MRLVQEIPAIEAKINSGEISLSHIGLAQSLFRQEKKLDREFSIEQKLSVFEKIANKAVCEAERITISMSSAPELAKPDRINAIAENLIEMKFTASVEVRAKVERLKGYLAHKDPNISLGDLFEQLCDLGLAEWDPGKIAAPRKRRVTNDSSKGSSQAEFRRATFRRANNACENCGSTYALEIDHIEPQAKGGLSTRQNLRVLCRSCNQRAAIKEFGQVTMDQFIN